MQSSLKSYLLHRNKSSQGLLACNMAHTCQNNMLALQELSQTLFFKQKSTKISLKQVSGKIKDIFGQNEQLEHRSTIQNDFSHPKNHKSSKTSSKKSIHFAKSPRFYRQFPHLMQYSTPFTQFLRDVSLQQTQSPQLSSHYPNHNSQCKQNKCHLFRNVFDSPQSHSTSKDLQLQASREIQKPIKVKKKSLTYDLCKSQSLSFQSKQIISQHPELKIYRFHSQNLFNNNIAQKTSSSYKKMIMKDIHLEGKLNLQKQKCLLFVNVCLIHLVKNLQQLESKSQNGFNSEINFGIHDYVYFFLRFLIYFHRVSLQVKDLEQNIRSENIYFG